MNRFTAILLFLLFFSCSIAAPVYGQVSRKKKDFQCLNDQTYAAYDLLKTTRSYGNYEPEREWSHAMTSDDIVRKSIELEGGRQYTILLVTQKDITASAIEIRDQYGFQLEYVYKVTELDRGQINLFYTPDIDGIYQIYFRVISSKASSACTYMAVLKGDLDPEFGIEEEDLTER